MQWNVAQAKQQFSKVVRQAAMEPQQILNRGSLAALILGPEEATLYLAWQRREGPRSLVNALQQLGHIAAEEDYMLAVPPRRDRENNFHVLSPEPKVRRRKKA